MFYDLRFYHNFYQNILINAPIFPSKIKLTEDNKVCFVSSLCVSNKDERFDMAAVWIKNS